MTPWKRLARRTVYERRPWLAVHVDRLELPGGRIVEEFHQVEVAPYVIVLAETPAGELVMMEQYRHGVGGLCLSLPGGMIDPGEEPEVAARRELLEETGYRAEHFRLVQTYVAMANMGGCTAHLFHAANAVPVTAPDSGDLEEAELLTLSRGDVRAAIQAGRLPIANILMAAGLWLAGF
ncbi:NUDIX hydrolase [Zavarzinia aquatilis]|uniref:GDP-mannose pyrophosphatase n=1 Tax=Zavarzinia aquatilis TaxID=2211142 RepID=A0A317EC89_9PROT|nr:NUDIX hydrolase [Zavarzinia aquatilis]PWR24242.1 NUDIX hydrolase [Zavarzinia aquatilis]